MSYTYLEDEAIADIAFIARGPSLEELFSQAFLATVNLQTTLSELSDQLLKPFEIQKRDVERLLKAFLDEIVYLKDAELFFPKSVQLTIDRHDDNWKAVGQFYGEIFDDSRHSIGNDLKAITWHDFYVKETKNGWECYVLIDI